MTTRQKNTLTTQSGFSLSEVLISLFLASIIMTSLTQFYLASKRQYLEARELLEQNFELQWVSDLFSDSVRRAGFTPCVGIDHLITQDRRREGATLFGLHIEPQFIKINRMSEYFSVIKQIASPSQVIISNSYPIHEGRPVLIADCEHAEVHEVALVQKSNNGTRLILTKALHFSYTKPVYIGEWLEEQWFIRPNARGEKTLHYRLVQTEELSSIIHNLKIEKEKSLIRITMSLDKEKERQINVAVRGL